MKRFFSLAAVAVVLTVFISSCEKKGCTDPNAKNYDSSAKSSDGSCTYQGSVVIWADQTFATAAVTAGVTTWNFSINGSPVGSMATSTYFASAPDCGANGAITIVEQLGTQTSQIIVVSVTDQNGAAVATYNVTFVGGACKNWQLQ